MAHNFHSSIIITEENLEKFVCAFEGIEEIKSPKAKFVLS